MWDRLQKTPREQWFPWASLASIVSLTIGGIMVGSIREPLMDAARWGVVLAVLLVVAIVQPLVTRFVFLPRIVAEAPEEREYAVVYGYAVATAPPAYGAMIVIMSGEGLLVLPFAFIAFISWLVMRSYFKDMADVGA